MRTANLLQQKNTGTTIKDRDAKSWDSFAESFNFGRTRSVYFRILPGNTSKIYFKGGTVICQQLFPTSTIS